MNRETENMTKAEMQRMIRALQQQVETTSKFQPLLQQLKCTDKRCAEMLDEIENILFIGGSKKTAYIFNKQTVIWEYCEDPQTVLRTTTNELCGIAQKKYKQLQTFPEFQDLSKRQVSEIEKTLLRLEDTTKVEKVLKQVTVMDHSRFDKRMKPTSWNSKNLDQYSCWLPIKGGCYDLCTGQLHER